MTEKKQKGTDVGLLILAMVGQAAMDVGAMDQAAEVQLADEIFAHQPNLLGSILVLPRMGVTKPEL